MASAHLQQLRRLAANLGPALELPRVEALIARWEARPPYGRPTVPE